MTGGASRVLLVEDEAAMRRFLRATLLGHGYAVTEASSADEGVALAAQHAPDIVLLDLGLPDRDGLVVARRLREWSQVPIVISARGREQDKVEALDLGVDDYLTKPFGTHELLARMRVALKHAARATPAGDDPRITVGEIVVDPIRRQVLRSGLELHLHSDRVPAAAAARPQRRARADASPDPARRVGPRAHDADRVPSRRHAPAASQAGGRSGASQADRHGARRRLSHARAGRAGVMRNHPVARRSWVVRSPPLPSWPAFSCRDRSRHRTPRRSRRGTRASRTRTRMQRHHRCASVPGRRRTTRSTSTSRRTASPTSAASTTATTRSTSPTSRSTRSGTGRA